MVPVVTTTPDSVRKPPKRDLIKILCVDDSTYNLFVLTELLKEVKLRKPLEVETALNG
jgi:hypothetical protein